jgi:anti-anti-sigma factor
LIGKDSAGVVHVAAHGEAHSIDFTASAPAHFDGLLGGEWAGNRILLNMDNVPYLVSAAIGWLLNSQKQFRANGGMLVLHSVQPNVLNILKLLKVERVVPIGGTEKEGLALFAAAPKAAASEQAA